MKKDELREMVKNDIPWTLQTVIRSFDNACDMKKIKAELVPSILTQSEWSGWSNQARKILKSDPGFGNLPDKRDVFTVRESPITLEEKLFNRFKAENDFFNRLQVIREYVEDDDASLDSEFFAEMFDYFTSYIRSFNAVNDIIVSSYFFVREMVKEYPYLDPQVEISFSELLEKIDDVEELFSKINDTEIKRMFLREIKQQTDTWPEEFVRLFPSYLSRYIVDELLENSHRDKVSDMFNTFVDNYRDYREPFIWVARNISEANLQEKYGIEFEKVLIGLIHLLDITFREVDNRRDVSLNRKINKQIQNFLFKENHVQHFIEKGDRDSVNRIYNLIHAVKGLDPAIKIELRKQILEKYPDITFYGEAEREKSERRFLVTSESYYEKQKELTNILEVEVPKNSKEIGAAIELGDLRENAEYKAAKERQDFLNNAAGKLKEDLGRAHIVSKDEIDTSSVSFGTRVILHDNLTDSSETFTILGPWESAPDKNTISYLSPLGNELLNHKTGDKLNFTINEREYSYTIEEILAADI
jgi:transcription elongation factor GreA